MRIFLNRYRGYSPCGVCHTTRLKPEALHFLIGGKNIAEVQALSVDELLAFLGSLAFKPEEKEIVEDLLIAAHEDARKKGERLMEDKMKAATAGLPLPPGMKLPF